MIECFERAKEFDIIHNHLMGEGLLAASLVGETPTMTTLHGPISDNDSGSSSITRAGTARLASSDLKCSLDKKGKYTPELSTMR